MPSKRSMEEVIELSDSSKDDDLSDSGANLAADLTLSQQQEIGRRTYLAMKQVAKKAYRSSKATAKKICNKSLFWQYNRIHRQKIRKRTTNAIKMRRRHAQQATPGFEETAMRRTAIPRNSQLNNSNNSNTSANDRLIENCEMVGHANDADVVDWHLRGNAQENAEVAETIKIEPKEEQDDEQMEQQMEVDHENENENENEADADDDDEELHEDDELIEDDGDGDEDEEPNDAEAEDEDEDEDEDENVEGEVDDAESYSTTSVHEKTPSPGDSHSSEVVTHSLSESSSSNNDSEMHDNRRQHRSAPMPRSPPSPPPYPHPLETISFQKRSEINYIMNTMNSQVRSSWIPRYAAPPQEAPQNYSTPAQFRNIERDNYHYLQPIPIRIEKPHVDMQQNGMRMPKLVVNLSSDEDEAVENAATAAANNQAPMNLFEFEESQRNLTNDITMKPATSAVPVPVSAPVPVPEKQSNSQDLKELIAILTNDSTNDNNDNNNGQNMNHNDVDLNLAKSPAPMEEVNPLSPISEETFLLGLFERDDYEPACKNFLGSLDADINNIEQEISYKDKEVLELMRQKQNKLHIKQRVVRFLNHQKEMYFHNASLQNPTNVSSCEADKSKEHKVSSSQDMLKGVAALAPNKVQQAVQQQQVEQARNIIKPPELRRLDELPTTSTGKLPDYSYENFPHLPPTTPLIPLHQHCQAPTVIFQQEPPSTSSSSELSSDESDSKDSAAALLNMLMQTKKIKRKRRKQKMLKRLAKVCQPSKKKKKFHYVQHDYESAAPLRYCDYCKTKVAQFACGKCQTRIYCTKLCQQLDFPLHYMAC